MRFEQSHRESIETEVSAFIGVVFLFFFFLVKFYFAVSTALRHCKSTQGFVFSSSVLSTLSLCIMKYAI